MFLNYVLNFENEPHLIDWKKLNNKDKAYYRSINMTSDTPTSVARHTRSPSPNPNNF